MKKLKQSIGLPMMLARKGKAYSLLAALLTPAAPVLPLLFESKLLFMPSREMEGCPADHGLKFEELVVTTPDGCRIHGWLMMPEVMTPDGKPKAWVLYSHGTSGNISSRPEIAARLIQRGIATLVYDYRGYGNSEGTPTEKGTYTDGETMLHELLSRAQDPRRVFLFGRSLGGGVSHELAFRHPELGGLITDAAFTSVQAITRILLPIPFMWRFVRSRYDNLSKARALKIPRLVMHGTDDTVVPFSMGEELRDCTEPKSRFHAIEEAGHMNTYVIGGDEYADVVSKFIDSCIERSRDSGRDSGPDSGPDSRIDHSMDAT